MLNEKRTYLTALQQTMTGLAGQVHMLEDLKAVYDARQYGPGGTNAITETELSELGMTTNDLLLAIMLLDNLNRFFKGEAVTVSNYMNILHEIRTDL